MPEYLLSVYGDESEFAAAEANPELIAQLYGDVEKFNQRLRDAGAWVFAGGLQPSSTATVVRSQKGGDVITTDGPYIEFKEKLGGLWVIDVPDLDAALTWARDGSAACQGPVEVRPFQEEPEA